MKCLKREKLVDSLIKNNRKCPVIAVVIEAMWGSIDWILPVCKFLKDEHKGTNIYFILLRYNKNEIFNENTILRDIIFDVANNNCYDLSHFYPSWSRILIRLISFLKIINNWFSAKAVSLFNKVVWYIFVSRNIKKWMREHKPDILLKEITNKPSLVFNVFLRSAKEFGSKIIFFPTAPSFTFAPDMWIQKEAYNAAGGINLADYFLVDKDWDAEYYRRGNQNAVVVGTPKFDDNWIQYIKSRYAGEKNISNKQSETLLFLLKNEKSLIFKYIDFLTLVKEIVGTIINTTNYNLVLKPHPRQNLKLLLEIISPYERTRITISHEPAFKLINESKYVIALPTGAIMDILIMGRPVIEYFDFKKLNSILLEKYKTIPKNSFGGMSFLDSNGWLTSVFRAKDLVVAADNPKELKAGIDMLERGLVGASGAKIKNIFFENEAKKSAEFILNLMDKN